jgi:flagellar protein FlaI
MVLKSRKPSTEDIEKKLMKVLKESEEEKPILTRLSYPADMSRLELLVRYKAGYKEMAEVSILRDPETESYYYYVDEPAYSDVVMRLYRIARDHLKEIPVMSRGVIREEIIEDSVAKALEAYGLSEDYYRYPELAYYMVRDMGYWLLDVPMRDPHVEEIDYSGSECISIAVRRAGVLKDIDIAAEWLGTNICLSEEDVRRIIEIFASKVGAEVTIAKPIAEFKTPEGHRVATNLSEIGRTNNITIRKHPEIPLTIADLIRRNTLSPLMAAYLWTLVENRKLIFIVGGMASGKTTLLNTLLSMVPRDIKITVMEDTPELHIIHDRVQMLHTRRSYQTSEMMNIDLDMLARYALRTRAGFIVIGEARDIETRTLVQAASTGHGGATTIHADDIVTLFNRLVSPPLSIRESFLLSISAIVFQARTWSYRSGGFVRRTKEIYEVIGLKQNSEDLIPIEYRRIFYWDPYSDTFHPDTPEELIEISEQLKRIAMSKYGYNERIWRAAMTYELMEKIRVLQELAKREDISHKEVADTISKANIEIRKKLTEYFQKQIRTTVRRIPM